MNILLYRLRSTLLRTLIPEFVWPKWVVIDGARIKVRNTPYSFGVKRVLTQKLGDYELGERKLLVGLLELGDVVVEMGGSIGVLTAIIAEKVGSSGFVISVEASVKLTEYSRPWLESGNNVKVLVGFGFPVWELKHPIEIQKFEEKWGSMSGRLTFKTGRVVEKGRSTDPSQPLYDLRTLFEYAKRPPVTLVVDIEGSERIICSQKPDFPKSLRNLLIELHPGIYGEDTKREIVRRIEEDGFKKLAEQGNVFLFSRSSIA